MRGKGLIPAKVDPVTGKVMLDDAGAAAAGLRPGDSEHAAALLSYRDSRAGADGAAGELHVGHGGQCDRVQHGLDVSTFTSPTSTKARSDAHYLKMGRWATVGGILLSMAAAYAATGLQQYYGYAAAGVFLCECAAVCDVPAGDVLEADDGACGVYRPGERHAGRGPASWADVAGGCAIRHPRRVDCMWSMLSERHGAEFLDRRSGRSR